MPELKRDATGFSESEAQTIANAIEGLVTQDRLSSTSEFDPAEYPLSSIVNHLGRLSVRDVDHRDGTAQAATFTVYAPGVEVGNVWGRANNEDYVWRGVHGRSVYEDGDVVGSSNNVFQVFVATGTPGLRHLDPPAQFIGTAASEEEARNRATAVGDVFIVGDNLLVVNTFTAGEDEFNRPFWRDLLQDEIIFINGTTLPTASDVAVGDRRKLHILVDNGVVHSIAHLRTTDERIGQWTIGQSGSTLGYRRGQYGRVNPGLNIERLYNVLDTAHTGSAVWLYVDSTGTIPRQPNVTLYYREQDTTGNWRRELLSGGGDGSYVSGDHLISAVPRIERGKTYDVAITTGGSGTGSVATLPTRTDYITFKPEGLEWVTLLDADAVDINRVHLDTILDLAIRQPRHYPVSLDWDNTNLRLSVQLPDGSVVEEGDLIALGPMPSGMTSTDESGFTMSVNGGDFHDVTGQDQSPIVPNRFHAGRHYQALVLDLEYVILDTYNLNGYVAVPAGGTDTQILAKASDDDYDTEWVDAPTGGGGGGGLTQAQVDARVTAGVADWAEEGNTEDIPENKLPTAATEGLNQTEVDARVTAVIPVNRRIPAGGTDTQVLAKGSDTDYDTEWVDASAGGDSAEVEEEVLYEDTADRTYTVTVWNTLTMSRALTEADDGKDIVVLLKSYVTDAADLTGTVVDTDIWESHVIPASDFRLLDNQTDAGTNGTHEPHFQWSVARGKDESTDWSESDQSTVRLGKGSGTSWRIGSPDISYWRRVKIKLVNRVAGEAGSSGGLTNLFDGSQALTVAYALLGTSGIEVPADKYMHVYFRATDTGDRDGAVGALSFPSNELRSTESAVGGSHGQHDPDDNDFTIPFGANRYVALSTNADNEILIAAQNDNAAGTYTIKIDYSDDLIGSGSSSDDAQEGEDTGVTTIGGIHVRWRLQQWSATEPAANTIPEPENGSFSDLGDWIREDQDPMTLGQDTSLQQWIGMGSGFLEDDGSLTSVTKQVIAAWNLQYNEADAGTEPAESDSGWSNDWTEDANWRRFRMPSGDWHVEGIPSAADLRLVNLYYGAAHASNVGTAVNKSVTAFGTHDYPFIIISMQPFEGFGDDSNGINRAHKRNVVQKIIVPKPADGWRSSHYEGFAGSVRLGLIYRANDGITWSYQGITRDGAAANTAWPLPADSGSWTSATQRISLNFDFDNENGSNYDEVTRFHLSDHPSAGNRFYLRVEALVA